MAMTAKSGLRLKLTAAFMSLSCLTVLLLGYLTIQHSYKALKTQKQQDELVMAKNISAQIDEVLGKAKDTISNLAHHRDITGSDIVRRKDALDIVTQVTELIDGIAVIGVDGKVIAVDRTAPDTETILPPAGEIHKLFVAPLKKEPATQFSRIFKSKSGEISAGIIAPVFRDGTLSHTIVGFIILKNHTMGGIEKIRIGKTGYAYIVDAAGNIIVHPQKERLLENFSDNPAVSGLLTEKEGITEFTNKDDVRILAAFARIEETGWGVVVRQPTEESYTLAEQNFLFLVIVFLGSLAAALAFGVYLARKISNPVTALLDGVNKVAGGDLDTRIPVKTGDEIGQLAAAFNDMTGKLRAHIDEIDRAHSEVLKTQKQLLQSEKMAAIGQLAAGLAHEIYNPLNVISGFTEVLLKQGTHAETGKRHLEEIYRETGRCQKLIADLLRFAKPKNTGRDHADIGVILQETLSLIQAQAKTQGISVNAEMPPELPPATVDRDQVKQVLLNLLLNACQAMPEGGDLSVKAYRENNSVLIAVKDTGIGIKQQDIKNIFNPFFTTKAEGTGLGLALSYAAMESHGGTITVASEEGKGSIFTISFPLPEGKHEKTG